MRIYEMALLRPFSLVMRNNISKISISNKTSINPHMQILSKPIVPPTLPNLICLCEKKTIAEELGIPEPPKKPLPGFFVFISDNAKAYPGVAMPDRVKLLKDDWLNLNPATKATYTNNFVAHLKEYHIKYSNYLKSLTDEQKKQIKALRSSRLQERRQKRTKIAHQKALREAGKPEHPGSVFAVYCKTRDGDQPLSELIKEWKRLPKEKKDYYFKIYQDLFMQYRQKLSVWQDQMIKSGRGYLLEKIPSKK